MASCVPTGPVVEALADCRNWVTYSPSQPYAPDFLAVLSEAHITRDLTQLYNTGFRGLVTYTLDGPFGQVPRIAKQVGFTQVVAGAYWYDDAQLAREKPAALAALPYIDAIIVGNEGLEGGVCQEVNGRQCYSRQQLAEQMAWFQTNTLKPVSTTEAGFQALIDPTLLDLGDFATVNIQPWFNASLNPNDPAAMAQAVSNEYVALQNLRPNRSIFVKEAWYSTSGNPAATEANQEAFFAALAQDTQVPFIWGESFDQEWKSETSSFGTLGRGWGLFTSAGVPKAVINDLVGDYTVDYEPPTVTDATTFEDVRTSSGLVIGRPAVDGETITHFKIRGITNGRLFLANGRTAVAEGSFITVAQGAAGLRFQPAANFSGVASFKVQGSLAATNVGLRPATAVAHITVMAVADVPALSARRSQSGNEGAPIPLALTASLTDRDGSETLAVNVAGLPSGATLNHGVPDAIVAGQWNLAASDLPGLAITFLDNGAFTLTAQAASTETATGMTAWSPTRSIRFTVRNVAPTPIIAGLPTTSPVNALLTLMGSATDPSAADTSAGFTYAWLVTNARGNVVATGTAAAFSFTPTTPGTYNVRLQVKDKNQATGSLRRPVTITAVAGQPPASSARLLDAVFSDWTSSPEPGQQRD